ncbi:NAD(P)-binding protein [Neolentinus lepideus HHB14362 ss-1]|uniref:NAD(P)-binding protein n=1 Tax=Neolentinus lepideus HHB14362 ss-1 TaxID=1314782 RepID=A0A165RTU7_9AGAM|nr:NAD(P)-binding protein [Neolentinus lepideus HHB14362 ss-1]
MDLHAEDLGITHHHDVYFGIDINGRLKDAAKGKVIYITGASRGIGAATALAYAQAGAKSLFLTSTSRSAADLRAVGDSVKAGVPGVEVEVYAVDVNDEKRVKESVEKCIEKFGKIDVVIANAGYLEKWQNIGDIDPAEWWKSMEVSLRGTFNVVHHSIHSLVETKGYAILLSSVAAQLRGPGSSAYSIAKHALNRFAEFIDSNHRLLERNANGSIPEYGSQGVKVFSVHPGGVITVLSSNEPKLPEHLKDKVELSSHSMVRLTSGSEDWLTGRYVSCQWDLDELETKRKEIEEGDLLKNRLDIGILG